MAYERLHNEFSRLIEERVRTGHAIAFGDENRFGELIAVFGGRIRQPLNRKRWKAETESDAQLRKQSSDFHWIEVCLDHPSLMLRSLIS